MSMIVDKKTTKGQKERIKTAFATRLGEQESRKGWSTQLAAPHATFNISSFEIRQ